jgi:predicted deacylase
MPRMRTTITLNGVDVPAIRLRGAQDGPRVTVIGGVHGCEYSSIAAVTRLMRDLAPDAGEVIGVPVVSWDSFTERSPFVVPADGKNLNRAFPGDAAGSYTDRLAHDIFTQLIEPADAVLDLHGGDLVEALEPFVIYNHDRARDLALAFGLPYVVDSTGELTGTTSGAAAAAGIPAVIAEAGGIGQLEEEAVQLLTRGARNALTYLGVLAGTPEPPRSKTVTRFDWLYSTPAGFWVSTVTTGQLVAAGDFVGEVRDLYGDVLQTITAEHDGVVLFLTTSAAVKANGLLMGLGGGER